MTNSFGLRHMLIFLVLLAIIPAPRHLAGRISLTSARASAAMSEYDTAAALYVFAANRLPWYCPVFGEAGDAYWLDGQPGESATWFSRGESCHGLSQDQWITYGDALASLGNQDSATRAWKLGLAHYGPSHGTYIRLAEAASQAGDFSHAIDLYSRAIELSPDDADSHYQMALILVATDTARALPELMQVSSLDPDRETDIRMIRTELNRAFLVDDPSYQFTRAGRALASLDEWHLAAEAFDHALTFNDTYAEAWAWLAEARQMTGTDGRPAMDKALVLDPLSPGIHGLDGLVWMQMGVPENARLSYEIAAELEPENAIWQVAIGDAASAAGDLQAALQYYYQAIDMAPTDPATWRALALFSLDHEIDVANTGLAAARELYQLAPDDWLTCLISGRASMMLNSRLEARTLFMRAVELAPEEPAPHYYLGLSYLEARMYTLAYDKLMDAIHLDPAGFYAWQAQRLLEEYYP